MTGDARIISALPLHRLAAAQFDAHGFRQTVFGQPGLQIVLGFAIQERAGRLAYLLAQIGTGDEDFGDDFGKAILRRLRRLAALRGILPHPIEIGADVFDRVEVFKQGDQPDRGQFDRRVFPARLLRLDAHLPVERDQRFRF